MNKQSRSRQSVAPRCGALVMLIFEDAEVLDIAGPLDILCAAGVRAPRDHRRPLLVSEHGGLVRTYPRGITLACTPISMRIRRKRGSDNTAETQESPPCSNCVRPAKTATLPCQRMPPRP